jgi:hypothetical protein
MDHASDRAVRLRAEQQGGLFTTAQAVELGLTRQSLWRRCRWGWFEALPRGVFRVVGVPRTEATRWFGALLGIGRGAVLACHTACRVFGLGAALDTGSVHVLLPCTCPHDAPGVVVHRSLTLRPDHVTTRRGLAVTTVERTLCDVAGRVGPVRLRRLVAEAVRRDLTTAGAIRATMATCGRFKGVRALRELVEELSPLHRRAASELESEFVALMVDAGLPPSAMNHPVVDARGTRRLIDAVYLPERVPIELDSRLAHGSLLDWHDDTRRENAVVLTGWHPFLRFNWVDVTSRGGVVVDTVRRALAAAR